MAHSRRSLQLTTRYQQRLDTLRQSLERRTRRQWPTLDGLADADWLDRTAAVLAQAQREAVRASAGYLSAYLTSELGRRTQGPRLDSRDYVGLSRDGRVLRESLQSPIIGARAKLKEGASPQEAMRFGLDRAVRQIGVDFDHAHRAALLDGIAADDRFDGWRRAIRGTCGACAAVAGKLEHGLSFSVHPGCKCVSEPNVAGLTDQFPRLSGAEVFAQKSTEELDEAVGPATAALLREGRIELADLVEHEELDSDQPGFITQKPIDRLLT